MKTIDEVVEQLSEELVNRVDSETVAAGLSAGDTAQVYRELIEECLARADCLDEQEATALDVLGGAIEEADRARG